MSRKSRTDAYFELWIRFKDRNPQKEVHLMGLREELIRVTLETVRKYGHEVYATDFIAKDEKVQN